MLKKEYLALVHHPFSEETQKETIRLSMEQIPGDDPDSFDPSGKRITKMRICKEGNGLWATTHYEAVLQDPFWAVVKPAARIRSAFTWHLLDIHFSEIRSTESATAVPVPRSMPGNCTFCSR